MNKSEKKCPKCGFVNIVTARFCSRRDCDYIFPMPEQPKQEPDPKPKPQQIDNHVHAFQNFAKETIDAINKEIDQCLKSIKPINEALPNDASIRKAYVIYLANYDAVINTLDKVEVLANNLQTSYNQYKAKLPSSDHSSFELLELLFQKAYNNTIGSINDLVLKYSNIRPFDNLKSYLLSPISDWNDTFDRDDLLSSFMYLGVIGKDYVILGKKFRIEKREYIEFLHTNNLVIRYNNASEKQCLELVATIIGRILNKCLLRLPIYIIDHNLLGIHEGYNYMPETVFHIKSSFDFEMIRGFGRTNQKHGVLPNNKLFVLKDWYACKNDIRSEEQLGKIMELGLDAGHFFIVMVNEDTKASYSSFRRDNEEDLLSELDHKITLNSDKKDGDFFCEYDLMGAHLIEKTRNLIQTTEDTMEQSKSIDISELFRRVGSRICKLKMTLYIGKDDQLNDKTIELKDDRIHSSLLVRYDNHSHVFPWVKAMIAEAFILYGSQQANVVVADLIGCDELDTIHSIDSRRAPFYYFKFKKDASTSNKVISTIKQFLEEHSDQRMLVFLVGKFEDLKNSFVNTKYHDKKNLHLVLLVTDAPRDVVWEGYQLTFGPKRLDTGVELCEDEFCFENKIWDAYSCDNNMFQQLLKDYLPVPQPQKANPKPIHVDQVEKIMVKPASEQEIKPAIVEQHEEKPKVVEAQVVSPVEVQTEAVEMVKETEKEFVETMVEDEEDDDVEKYDYQRTFYFRDHMTPPSEWWTQSAKEEMVIPFGIHINRDTNTDEVWEFKFSTSNAMQNVALVLGGVRSGKTVFLRTLIMSAAQLYSPKELEFYLIDFKTTGFEPFELGRLPHARVVAGGADREFGLSILQKVKNELDKRKKTKDSLPRILLVIDECQDFFLNYSEDDPISEKAGVILEYIIRQGAEFGINLILATQELSSKTTNIPSSLYNLIAIRYVAKPTEEDYLSLFNRGQGEVIPLNSIYHTGEALFVEAKYMKPEDTIEEYHTKAFYIESEELPAMIQQVSVYANNHPEKRPSDLGLFTFHNDDDLVEFRAKERMIGKHLSPAEGLPKTIPMYLGQPIAMDNDVFLSLAAKKKQNVLIVGAVPTDDIVGQNIAYIALLSSTKAYPANQEGCTTNRMDYLFDFTEEGEPLHGKLDELVSQAPFGIGSAVIEAEEDAVLSKLSEIKEELERRKEGKSSAVKQHIFLTFLGFDRGDMFEDEEEATDTLSVIIDEGPKNGIFTIIQAFGDENMLNQKLGLRIENGFQHIVALQMSKDSSYSLIGNTSAGQLYDPSAVADKLGLYRALYYNNTSNTITKFKPYKF